MKPPLCPLHEIQMVKTITVDGRDHFKCPKKGCSVEINRPDQPKEGKP